MAPGAKQGQADCPAQVCPLPPAGSSRSSDNHQYRHCHWMPGPIPSSSHSHSFNPHNNLTGGYCYHLYIRCGTQRHREVDCLWKPDLNLGSLALSLHSAVFPKRTICHFPNPKPWMPFTSTESGSRRENNPQTMREERHGAFPPKTPQDQRTAGLSQDPMSASQPLCSGKIPFHRLASPPHATVHYWMVLVGEITLALVYWSTCMESGAKTQGWKKDKWKTTCLIAAPCATS